MNAQPSISCRPTVRVVTLSVVAAAAVMLYMRGQFSIGGVEVATVEKVHAADVTPSVTPSPKPGDLVRSSYADFVKTVTAPGYITDFKFHMPNFQCSPVNEHVLANYPLIDGIIVECGVWQAFTTNIIGKAHPERHMYGFDSFRGLPEDWVRGDRNITTAFFNKGGNLPGVPPNVKLVPGWFNETLPPFVKEHSTDAIAYLHVDCDIYSSTVTVLTTLAPLLRPGTIIVFDDMFNYPGYENHELLAMYEFFASTEWRVEWLGKQGHVTPKPERDEGFWVQAAAIRIW